MVYYIPEGQSELAFESTENISISTFDSYLRCVYELSKIDPLDNKFYIPFFFGISSVFYFTSGNNYKINALSAFEIVTS